MAQRLRKQCQDKETLDILCAPAINECCETYNDTIVTDHRSRCYVTNASHITIEPNGASNLEHNRWTGTIRQGILTVPKSLCYVTNVLAVPEQMTGVNCEIGMVQQLALRHERVVRNNWQDRHTWSRKPLNTKWVIIRWRIQTLFVSNMKKCDKLVAHSKFIVTMRIK